MERDERIKRGNNAQRLLEDSTFTAILDDLLAESFGRFVASGVGSSDDRTDIWASGQAIAAIRERLEYYITDGKMEVANAEYDNGL